VMAIAAALAQTDTPAPQTPAPQVQPAAPQPAPAAPQPQTAAPLPPVATPLPEVPAPIAPPPGPPKNAVLELKALDKITGKAVVLMAPLNKPVQFATLTITARTCYSTPISETPETSAFLQIDDHRPDKTEARMFSGWMYASSPGLNSLQHPLYDVWVISCIANAPGQAPKAVAEAPVKVVSPNAGANEAMPALPEDAGQ
jgi:hypothetical protein